MSTLKEHERSHTGEKPYACDKCPTRFVRKNDQVRHRNTKHKDEKEHVCEGFLRTGASWGCGARFARADALKEHWKKNKLDCRRPYLKDSDPTLADEVELFCDICLKKSKGHLKFRAHLEAHIEDCNDPPYPCDCGLSFAFPDVRDRHSALFLPPTCGFRPQESATGPGARSNPRKRRPEWGCGQRFLSHKDLAGHIKSTQCGNELRAAELREADSLRLELKADIETETKFLHQPNRWTISGQNQESSSVNIAQQEQARNALRQSRAYEELASVNRVRVEQIEREPYHEQLCLLYESYITRFGKSQAPDILASRNAPPAGKTVRKEAGWGVLEGSTMFYLRLRIENEKLTRDFGGIADTSSLNTDGSNHHSGPNNGKEGVIS
jgi:hypothetical protein